MKVLSKFLFATALSGAALAASPAFAAPTITYTLTGNFSGTNGGPFSDVAAVFTGIGDPSTAFLTADGSRNVVLSSFSALAGGQTYNFYGTSLRFGTNAGFGGFIVDTDGNNPFVFTSGALAGYDGVSNIATTPVNFYGSYGTFNTDHGAISFSNATNLTFSAAAAVPETATWAMMLAGFGMIGFAARRRQAVKTTVTYA